MSSGVRAGKLFGVRLREWDPGSASQAELDAWLAAYNSALAVDLPGDPPWRPEMLRDYLTVTMPGERRLTWLVERTAPSNGSGGGEVTEMLGYGRLLLMDGTGRAGAVRGPRARRAGGWGGDC